MEEEDADGDGDDDAELVDGRDLGDVALLEGHEVEHPGESGGDGGEDEEEPVSGVELSELACQLNMPEERISDVLKELADTDYLQIRKEGDDEFCLELRGK